MGALESQYNVLWDNFWKTTSVCSNDNYYSRERNKY